MDKDFSSGIIGFHHLISCSQGLGWSGHVIQWGPPTGEVVRTKLLLLTFDEGHQKYLSLYLCGVLEVLLSAGPAAVLSLSWGYNCLRVQMTKTGRNLEAD